MSPSPSRKIVVVGGTGRVGSRLVRALLLNGHRVAPASPSTGVNAATGAGLDAVLADADVLIDVSNSPSLEGEAALAYFEAAGRNLAAAAARAGVRHHIALSIVGTDGLQASGYFQAKKLQEDLLKASGTPFTILRSTQFFEFIAGVVQAGAGTDVVLPPALVQPVSATDIAAMLSLLAESEPVNGTLEIAGPHVFRMDEVGSEVLTAYEDSRRVLVHAAAPYFGAELADRSLIPSAEARICGAGFEDWLRETLQPVSAPALARAAPRKGAFV